MIQANKNGFLYVLDRTNCALIAAHPFVKVNWASRIDMTTGRPVLTDVYKRLAGEEVEIWPSRGTNAVPIVFNPNTGLVYASTWNLPRIQKLGPPPPSTLGASTTGVTARLPQVGPGTVFGHLTAINPLTGEEVGGSTTDFPSSSGMLATGGRSGVHRQADRRVHCPRSGDRPHRLAVQNGIEHHSTAITYTYGRQSRVDRVRTRCGLANRYAADKIPTGGSMWTFALMAD